MINKKRLIKTFKKMAAISSLSHHEGKVVDFMKKDIRAYSQKIIEAGKPSSGEVGNILIDIPGSGINEPHILLNAHLDTVSPGEGIKPIEHNGYIVPAGKTVLGADDKAGVAAILEVVKVLKERKLKHPPLSIILTVAEEIGLVGAKAIPLKLLQADFGVTLDGGDVDKIVFSAPSQCNLVAKIIGKAAHAGIHPEEGINAIKIASIAISRMKVGRIDFETTANIGVIKGGNATNIIPDEVEIKGEARSHNRDKLERQVGHMEDVLQRACEKHDARLELKISEVYSSFCLSKTQKVVKLALCAVNNSGMKAKLVRTGGGSDANIFNELGIPTVITGVGADHVHTTNERIAVKDLVKGAEILLDFIRRSSD